MTTPPYKFFIKTFGCQMNLYDSWIIEDFLMSCNLFPTTNINEADVVIFNTCTVRQHAEDKALSYIGKMQKWKKEGKVLAVIGCVAERLKDSLKTKFPFIDIILGPKQIDEFPEFISAFIPDLNKKNICQKLVKSRGVSTFIAITKGCNNYCSYCIVPYVRGELKSRKFYEILEEANNLVENGVKEIILLGQNVNAYKDPVDENLNFVTLLRSLSEIKNLRRIGFLTNHPKDMTDDIIQVMFDIEKINKHLHLPVQSGCDRILKLMNRGYTRKDYLKLIEKIKTYASKANSEISITTDVIVGFPTESDYDFQETLSLFKEVEFDSAFCFKYSIREKTEAAKLKDDVEMRVKEERLQTILKLAEEIALLKNKKLIGSTQEVLIDEIKNGIACGKTKTGKNVVIESKNLKVGDLVNVKIVEATPYKVKGVQLRHFLHTS